MSKDNTAEALELFLEKYFSKNDLDWQNIDLRQKLKDLVSQWIDKDFAALVQLLYRIDVSEKDLRLKLRNAPLEQSTDIIVEAIIERQMEKQRTKNIFKRWEDIPEDERW